jgi:hypothetical protein
MIIIEDHIIEKGAKDLNVYCESALHKMISLKDNFLGPFFDIILDTYETS